MDMAVTACAHMWVNSDEKRSIKKYVYYTCKVKLRAILPSNGSESMTIVARLSKTA